MAIQSMSELNQQSDPGSRSRAEHQQPGPCPALPLIHCLPFKPQLSPLFYIPRGWSPRVSK